MSNRLDQERQDELQPKRIEYAVKQLDSAGYSPFFKNDTLVKFFYKEEEVTLFPYSGWFTGKSVRDGRDILNLLKQIAK